MLHDVKGSTCIEAGDGMINGGNIFYFNTVDNHVMKGYADVSKDLIFIGSKTA